MQQTLSINVFLAIWLVLNSWVLFCAYRIHTVLALIIILITGILVVLLSWYVVTAQRNKLTYLKLKAPTPLSGLVGIACIWIAASVLSLLAPAYSYYSGTHILQEMLTLLQVDAEVVEIDVHWIDDLSDIGEPRFVVGVYQVVPPLDDAKQKINKVLENRPGWNIARHGGQDDKWVASGICDISVGGPALSLYLQSDGLLTIGIDRAAPPYCFPN